MTAASYGKRDMQENVVGNIVLLFLSFRLNNLVQISIRNGILLL